MKLLFTIVFSVLAVSLIVFSCSKSSNNYAITDHTIGMTNTRNWTGYAYGNVLGDTSFPAPTGTVAWPKGYYRNVSDTPFAIIRVNGFRLNVIGVVLNFRSVDSVAKIVQYDSTYPNSAKSFLTWDFGKDTMHFEYHNISGYNSTADKYYEDNWVLRSTH